MKKDYMKPEMNVICFELNEDIVAASGDSKDVLDVASNLFEKGADGVLDFFSNLGGN